MGLEQAVEKLRNLGVFPKTVLENTQIFQASTTFDELGRQISSRPKLSVGDGQFLYFHLVELMGKDQSFKQRLIREALDKLGNTGIKPEHIEEYFNCGEDPTPVFNARHEEVSGLSDVRYAQEVMLAFYKRADQFALEKMREWLGFHEDQIE